MEGVGRGEVGGENKISVSRRVERRKHVSRSVDHTLNVFIGGCKDDKRCKRNNVLRHVLLRMAPRRFQRNVKSSALISLHSCQSNEGIGHWGNHSLEHPGPLTLTWLSWNSRWNLSEAKEVTTLSVRRRVEIKVGRGKKKDSQKSIISWDEKIIKGWKEGTVCPSILIRLKKISSCSQEDVNRQNN